MQSAAEFSSSRRMQSQSATGSPERINSCRSPAIRWHSCATSFRLAPLILIHEPNGNNFGLKIIEKTSPYHREHGEKSYRSRQITRWIRQAGGQIQWQRFAGFVPMFCPDWLAKTMKTAEPLIERIPGLSALACAVFVVVAARK